ncbi:MAG: hypothetical protein JJ858_15000 [Rhizobiaceae bacterium]|nr:hypothetical protein [Rhizobiaceae bacterium]
MGELLMAGPAWKLVAKQKILPNDVILLRQEVFPNGVVNRQDVATLLAIETACYEKCPQWDELFTKSIADYIVFAEGEHGVIDDVQALWIKQSLTRNGLADTKNEFATIVRILSLAKRAPSSVVSLALDQITHRIYASGANRRTAANVSEDARAIMIDLNKIIDVAKKFSIHEHLRAVGLSQLLDAPETVDESQEQEIALFYRM